MGVQENEATGDSGAPPCSDVIAAARPGADGRGDSEKEVDRRCGGGGRRGHGGGVGSGGGSSEDEKVEEEGDSDEEDGAKAGEKF